MNPSIPPGRPGHRPATVRARMWRHMGRGLGLYTGIRKGDGQMHRWIGSTCRPTSHGTLTVRAGRGRRGDRSLSPAYYSFPRGPCRTPPPPPRDVRRSTHDVIMRAQAHVGARALGSRLTSRVHMGGTVIIHDSEYYLLLSFFFSNQTPADRSSAELQINGNLHCQVYVVFDTDKVRPFPVTLITA